MKLKLTAASVTLATALGLLCYETIWGGGRPTIISGMVTLILVTPAQALDAYRRGKAVATPPKGEE